MYAYNLLELNHSILLMLFCALDGLYVPLGFFLLLSLVMPYVICFIVGFMYLSAFACLPVVRNVICLITCRTLCYWPQCAFRLLLSIYARCHILGVRPLCAFRFLLLVCICSMSCVFCLASMCLSVQISLLLLSNLYFIRKIAPRLWGSFVVLLKPLQVSLG